MLSEMYSYVLILRTTVKTQVCSDYPDRLAGYETEFQS